QYQPGGSKDVGAKGDRVKGGMQRHSRTKAEHWNQPAPPAMPRLACVAKRRTKERRKGRVAEPSKHDAPHKEKSQVAARHDGEVDEVLDHGESGADHHRIDDAVSDIVKLVAQEEEQQ